MTKDIAESDWKLFRKLHPVTLERFSKKILNELDLVRADDAKSCHQRYLDIFRLIARRDKELANLFDNLRRSTALMQIAAIYARGLMTEDELSGFSPALIQLVKSLTYGRDT